jgi:tetratricopeptide (TPR) repeat protein
MNLLVRAIAMFATACFVFDLAWGDPLPQEPASSDVQARAHFAQGKAFLDAKVYDQAIKEFAAAYALVPLPELMFDTGQAYRLSGQIDPALDSYQKYLAATPEGTLADEARVHVAELTKQRAEEQHKQQAALDAARADWQDKRDSAASTRLAGKICLGAGIPVLLVGLIVLSGGEVAGAAPTAIGGAAVLVGAILWPVGLASDPGAFHPPASASLSPRAPRSVAMSFGWRF